MVNQLRRIDKKSGSSEDKRVGWLYEQAAQLCHSEPYNCQAEEETLKVSGEESFSTLTEILRVKNDCHPQNDVMVHEPIKFIHKRRGKFAVSKFVKILLTNLLTYLPTNVLTRKKAAFTLAEVLITLGIIGVVAAMTLPALIQNNRETELTTRAKKTYSALNQAVKMFEAENGTPGDITGLFDAGGSPDSYKLAQNFAKYFNGAKVCRNNSQAGCRNYYYGIAYSSARTDGNGMLIDWNGTSTPKIILPDGAVIGISQYESCSWLQTSNRQDQYGNNLKDENGNILTITSRSVVCADIIVDTNGNKSPNKFGADAFSIQVFRNRIAPSGWTPMGGNSLANLLTNGKLIFTNYKSGEMLDF